MNPTILAVLIIGATLAPSRMVLADDALGTDLQKVMNLWCTQAGTWVGMIDVTGSDGTRQSLELVTTHDCSERWSGLIGQHFGKDK